MCDGDDGGFDGFDDCGDDNTDSPLNDPKILICAAIGFIIFCVIYFGFIYE
jgi:hypothetical protein